ncbi:MAG: hypothetical protein EOM06_09675 [Sphingobacteriia bacterium]|nr:hypothetical protein [Sphingobacteriia bacterium]
MNPKLRDKDFVVWKSSPGNFFDWHKELFGRIISRNSFLQHLNTSEKSIWVNELRRQMESPEVMFRLEKYNHQVSFMLFYIAVLRDVVIAKSQEEDLSLVKSDFNTLIVKYQPMAGIIVQQLTQHHRFGQDKHNDFVQQLLTNLLDKKEVIRSSYDDQRLFRNFIWKIALNEARNIIKAECRKQRLTCDEENLPAESLFTRNTSENDLIIQDVVGKLHCRVLSYMHLRFKLLLCLKALYDLRVFPTDIKLLFFNHKELKINDFQVVSDSLNFFYRSDNGKLRRFELISPFLNLAAQTNTDASSYWRWTNNETINLIQFLNDRYLMELNRETFGHLLERYFQKFQNDIQFIDDNL